MYTCFFVLFLGETTRKRAVLQKLMGNTMGVKPHLLLRLGGHSKQAGDECNLPHDVPFFHTSYPFLTMFITTYPCKVRHELSIEKKPSPGLTRRLMNRWSCSTIVVRVGYSTKERSHDSIFSFLSASRAGLF